MNTIYLTARPSIQYPEERVRRVPIPSTARWRQAQDYERGYWENYARLIESGATEDLDATYRWKASQMEKHLDGVLPASARTVARVLEVGCGPLGIVGVVSWGERHAVDPLDDFYASHPVLARHRPAVVRYQKSAGEQLPFPAERFDLIILENVLDHVREADRLLQEIRRLLKPSGLLYFTVNVRTSWGAALHSVLSALLIDKGHPYSFTAQSIRRFLSDEGFAIRRESLDDYRPARDLDRRSARLKDRIKGYSGLSEFVFYAVCSKAG